MWFEGAGGESLGQYGHSKDYRGHLKQVVLGIVLDDTDRPIASLRERFGIAEACIVADRGMISADTIAALEAEKVEYILGVRERTSREVRTEIIADDGLAVPLVIPRQKGETELAIRETTIAERRYVICRNEEEAKKDAAARAELVAGLERKLAQGDKALVANKGFRRFLKTPEGGGFVIDRAKIAADARFDGLFVLRTNTRIAALQVVLRYRNLLAVEDAFKTAKALLATRPIFHKTDAGIRGHVFCTFLALVLRKELFDRLGWPQPARMAAHHRRSRRSQRDRGRTGRPPGAAAHRPRPDHRPDLPRYRHHPAVGFPGDAARPLNHPKTVVPKTKNGPQAIDHKHRANRNRGSWV